MAITHLDLVERLVAVTIMSGGVTAAACAGNSEIVAAITNTTVSKQISYIGIVFTLATISLTKFEMPYLEFSGKHATNTPHSMMHS